MLNSQCLSVLNEVKRNIHDEEVEEFKREFQEKFEENWNLHILEECRKEFVIITEVFAKHTRRTLKKRGKTITTKKFDADSDAVDGFRKHLLTKLDSEHHPEKKKAIRAALMDAVSYRHKLVYPD